MCVYANIRTRTHADRTPGGPSTARASHARPGGAKPPVAEGAALRPPRMSQNRCGVVLRFFPRERRWVLMMTPFARRLASAEFSQRYRFKGSMMTANRRWARVLP